MFKYDVISDESLIFYCMQTFRFNQIIRLPAQNPIDRCKHNFDLDTKSKNKQIKNLEKKKKE